MEIAADHQQPAKNLSTLLILMLIIGSLMVTNVRSENTNVNLWISGLECGKSNDEDQLLRELSGSHLRLSASHAPPWLYITKSENWTILSYSGMNLLFFDFLARTLNVTYSLVNTRSNEEQAYGLSKAAIKLLLRKEVDIVTNGLILNMDHCTQMDCSVALLSAPVGLIVPLTKYASGGLLALIRPFQMEVWKTLLFTLILLSFGFGFLLQKQQKKNCTAKYLLVASSCDLGKSLSHVFSVLTGRQDGLVSRLNKFTKRIVVASWCLAGLVLVNAYSTSLMSHLLAKKLEPVTTTLEELAAGYPQNLKIMIEKNSVLADDVFLSATSGPLKILGDSLRRNPESLYINQLPTTGMNLLLSGHYAYPSHQITLFPTLERLNRNNDDPQRCTFTISNLQFTNIRELHIVDTFQKEWKYTKAVNKKLLLWTELGLSNHFVKSSRNPRSKTKCLLHEINKQLNKETKIFRSLSLVDLSGAFICLAFGLSLSLVVFIVERVARIVVMLVVVSLLQNIIVL